MSDPCQSFIGNCIRGDREAVRALIQRQGWSWERLFKVAADEAVLPALHGLLDHLNILPEAPPEIAEFLLTVEASNRARNRAIRAEVISAVRLLNGAGIEPVLLKGIAYLETGVYEDIAARYLIDVDLLVPETQLQTAADLLLNNSYVAEDRDAFGHFRHHHPPLRRPGSVSIEIHHRMGWDKCEKLISAREVIERAAPRNLDGLRVRIPCPEHLLVHLIMHSQIQHPYNERIWPPYRAMYDLVLLNRRFGPELHWDAVVRRFSASGQYGVLALHLLRVKASTGMELPFEVRAGLLTRLRWQRRQILRRWPALRYLDPVYMFSTVLGRRLAMLRKMLRTRDGVRHLFSQISALGNYSRIWTDLTEGRGR